MATTTDNLGLTLYEDNDPNDLRDGYNNSMHLLDDSYTTQNDKITEANANADSAKGKANQAISSLTQLTAETDDKATSLLHSITEANANADQAISSLTQLTAETDDKATSLLHSIYAKANSTDVYNKIETTQNLVETHLTSGYALISETNAIYQIKDAYADNEIGIDLTNGKKAVYIYSDTIDVSALTTSTDISTIVNMINSKVKGKRVYLKSGDYTTSAPLNFDNGNYPYFEGTVKATQDMDYIIGINQNTIDNPTFYNALTNRKSRINVDCDSHDCIGVAVSYSYRSDYEIRVKNIASTGVKTVAKQRTPYAENKYDIKITNHDVNNVSSTGVELNCSDDIIDNLTVVNTKTALDNKGSGTTIKDMHVWLSSSEMWANSVALKTSASITVISFYSDTYQTDISAPTWPSDTPSIINSYKAYINTAIVSTDTLATAPHRNINAPQGIKLNIGQTALAQNTNKFKKTSTAVNPQYAINDSGNNQYDDDMLYIGGGKYLIIVGDNTTNIPPDAAAGSYIFVEVKQYYSIRVMYAYKTNGTTYTAYVPNNATSITWKQINE